MYFQKTLVQNNLNVFFVFVTGYVKVAAPITEEDSINQILQWIGFTAEGQRDNMYDLSIDSLSYIREFTKKIFLIYQLTLA